MEEKPLSRGEESETAIPRPDKPVFVEVSGSELKKRAAQVGALAGQTVALLRDVRERLQAPGQSRADRLSELGAAARTKTLTRIDELRRQAREHAEKWRQAALERTAQLRRQARGRYEETRSRAQRVARDYPLHVVLAAGVAGFLLGAALRIWRAHRA